MSENSENFDPRVKQWGLQYPERKWAFDQLKPYDLLRTQVLRDVLDQNSPDSLHFQMLDRFREALETYQRTNSKGVYQSPQTPVGVRFTVDVYIKRCTLQRGCEFAIDVQTIKGWSGYWVTTLPQVIKKAHGAKSNRTMKILTSKFQKSYYPYLLALDPKTRIL